MSAPDPSSPAAPMGARGRAYLECLAISKARMHATRLAKAKSWRFFLVWFDCLLDFELATTSLREAAE